MYFPCYRGAAEIETRGEVIDCFDEAENTRNVALRHAMRNAMWSSPDALTGVARTVLGLTGSREELEKYEELGHRIDEALGEPMVAMGAYGSLIGRISGKLKGDFDNVNTTKSATLAVSTDIAVRWGQGVGLRSVVEEPQDVPLFRVINTDPFDSNVNIVGMSQMEQPIRHTVVDKAEDLLLIGYEEVHAGIPDALQGRLWTYHEAVASPLNSGS